MKDLNEINLRQKKFYDTKKKNLATKTWSYFRNGLLNKIRKNLGIEQYVYELHKSWLGDLSVKKVLDLGCYEGNSLSIYLATNAREYVGIDLSQSGISVLTKKIEHLPQAKALALDFLSEDFTEKEFDLIYAYGVLHHFKNTDEIIEKLNEKLNGKGTIISNDPLQTSLPIKFFRTLYRPFQSDRDWEWPFSKRVFYKYNTAFEILEKRAVLGKAKWFFLLYLLPISFEKKIAIGKKWHREDWERSNSSNKYMFNCMHLTMLMQKR